MQEVSILSGLFLAAFSAATLLPAQSEAVLAGLIIKTDVPVWLLILTASLGNILGSCTNWWLGRYIERYKNRTWFPVSEKSLLKAQGLYERYGRWSLLLSWVPFIGDPITVAAGLMKEKFLIFLIFVTLAKTVRYLVVAFLAV